MLLNEHWAVWIHSQEWSCWVDGSSVLRFLRSLHTVSRSACASLPDYTSSVQVIPFLHILANIVMCVLFEDRHSDRCEVLPQCSFDLHFPDDQGS